MTTDWFKRNVSVKKAEHGHKVYVDGKEIEGVKRISFDLEAQEISTVTIEVAAPTIDVEYDSGVYKR